VKAILRTGSARVGIACIMEDQYINSPYARMVLSLTALDSRHVVKFIHTLKPPSSDIAWNLVAKAPRWGKCGVRSMASIMVIF
jgi:hypothetical protein